MKKKFKQKQHIKRDSENIMGISDQYFPQTT